MQKLLKTICAAAFIASGATAAMAANDLPEGRNQNEGQLSPEQARIVAPSEEKGLGTEAHQPTGYRVSASTPARKANIHHVNHKQKPSHPKHGK